MVVGRSAIFAKPHRHSVDVSTTTSKFTRRHGEASKVKTSNAGRHKKSENRIIEFSAKHANKQHEENMEKYAVNNQRHDHPNQQQYHGIIGREQITSKKGSKHDEMPSFDLHAVIVELTKRKKNTEDRMALLVDYNKIEQQRQQQQRQQQQRQQQQQQQFSDGSADGPSNFNNYRRRLVNFY